MCGCTDVELLTSGFCRYREHVIWGEKDLRLKLLKKGILTRIYAPMVRIVISIFNNKKSRKIKTAFISTDL